MVDRSPPTQRVVDVLEAIAAEADRGWTLTELAETIDANKSTVLNITSQLVTAGWLVRRGTRYALGPAVISIGHVADRAFLDGRLAHPELVDLAERFRLTATSAAASGSEIILVDLATPDNRQVDTPLLIGQRFPFVPPTGAAFVAWDDEAFDNWVGRSPSAASVQVEFLRRIGGEIRQRGYGIERFTEASLHIRQLMSQLGHRAMTGDVRKTIIGLVTSLTPNEYLDSEIREPGRHPVATISAPVLDADGKVTLVIGAHPLRQLTPEEVTLIGTACLRAAEQTSQKLNSRKT